MCVFSSHPFWTSSSLDVPAGVTQEEGHTGFLIHLPSAVRALIFVARRIQPFLSLVDREVEFCVIVIITVYYCSTVCIVKVTEEFCTLYLDQTSSQCNISTFDTTIFWCPCIAIDVSVQYNGGLLPDIILLTQCYFHGGSRLNALKRFCICSL